jgi:hypothetical protein
VEAVVGYVPQPPPGLNRDDEHFALRCRVCSYCEHRETVQATTLAEAARPCPNCGARDWRDRVVRRVWPIETTTIER